MAKDYFGTDIQIGGDISPVRIFDSSASIETLPSE